MKGKGDDDESGESMQPMGELPYLGMHRTSELQSIRANNWPVNEAIPGRRVKHVAVSICISASRVGKLHVCFAEPSYKQHSNNGTSAKSARYTERLRF